MFRTSRLAGLALVGILYSVSTASAAEVNKYLPNDTEIVVSLNVRQVLDSKIVTKYALSLIKDMIEENKEARTILQSLDFDPLKDVEKLTIASAPEESSVKGLIILQGKFDVAKFEKRIEEYAKEKKDELKIHKIGTKKVYEIKTPEAEAEMEGVESQTIFFTFLDNKTIAASPNKDYVSEAIDKEAGIKESKLNKGVKTLIEGMDESMSFWGIASSSALAKSMPDADGTFNKFTSVSLGLHITDEIKAQLVMAAKDAKVAKELSKEMAEAMDQAKNMIAGFPIPNNKEILDLLDALKLTVADNNVILKGRIPADLIEKAIPQ